MVQRSAGGDSSKYLSLLKKLESVKSDSGFWKPAMGMNSIRILPEVGKMEFFFVEMGRHYVGDKHMYDCRNINSGGELECPLCKVNQLLYEAGEAQEAKKWRASKSYLMNVIVRGKESEGPKVYAAGQIVFGHIASLIGDPDVGDVSDANEGFDLKLERTGEGLDTRYTTREARNPTKLGTPDEIEKWLQEAKDLQEYVEEHCPDFNEVAVQSGAAVFIGIDSEQDLGTFDPEDPEFDAQMEEQLAAPPTKEESASDRIAARMSSSGRTLKLGKR